MIIKITSTNQDFISLLRKNPNSFEGVQLRQIKKGVGIGHIVSNHEYHLVFHDTNHSFVDKYENSKIDYNSFSDPRVFLSLASEFLRDLMIDKQAWFDDKITWLNDTKVSDLDVEGYTHQIYIENIYVDSLSKNKKFILSTYYPQIELIHKCGNLFSLKITTNKSLHELINLTALSCMYLSATNTLRGYFNMDMIRKYIRIMKNLDPVPYFVIYLFAKRCVRSKEDFELLKSELNSVFKGDLNMTWGTTQVMRLNFISQKILTEGKINNNVLEIGCGQLNYAQKLLGKLDDTKTWYAVDKVDYSKLISSLSKKHSKKKIVFSNNLNELCIPDNSICLLIEVIEHMLFDEAKKLVEYILTKYKPSRLIITTPNFAFNKHFALSGFRHEDHHFELNSDEFKNFIELILCNSNYEANYFGIGDEINGEFITSGAEIILREI
jgi:hypothetical protein